MLKSLRLRGRDAGLPMRARADEFKPSAPSWWPSSTPSDGLSSVTMKRQYWIMEDGRWKIFYEGAA
jgi:hypothetical protein